MTVSRLRILNPTSSPTEAFEKYRLFLVALLLLTNDCVGRPDGSRSVLIRQLFDSIHAEQVKENTQWIPFVSDAQVKGLFPSWIHLNFHGDQDQAQLRERIRFWDANNFVTNWILQVILETEALGAISTNASSLQILQNALPVLIGFKVRPSFSPLKIDLVVQF